MKHARIIATPEAKTKMMNRPPEVFQKILDNRPDGPVGDFIYQLYGPPFDFVGLKPQLPTELVEHAATLQVGSKSVELLKVGPAHTEGDMIAVVPSERTIFTGDIIFYTNTPILWSGPASNWIAAIDHILSLDIETVVPGHGPVTDKAGIRKTRVSGVYPGRGSQALRCMHADAGSRPGYRAGRVRGLGRIGTDRGQPE